MYQTNRLKLQEFVNLGKRGYKSNILLHVFLCEETSLVAQYTICK